MRSLESRLAALEKRSAGVMPAHRMLLGESHPEACVRLGLAACADVLWLRRVIVDPVQR